VEAAPPIAVVVLAGGAVLALLTPARAVPASVAADAPDALAAAPAVDSVRAAALDGCAGYGPVAPAQAEAYEVPRHYQTSSIP
jgi:hypothetical protein